MMDVGFFAAAHVSSVPASFGIVSVESFVNTRVTSDCILNQDWDFYRICCNPILFGTVGSV